MEFLNKLYESNYFGIGLFAVISFLVVTFLVVLFFGKKDEKRRKFESTNIDTFKETGEPIKLETPVAETTPVTPVNPVEPIAPVAPINYDVPEKPVNTEPISPVIEPVNGIINEATPITENVAPTVVPITPVVPVEPIVPIINEPATPVIAEPVAPINYEVPVSPVNVEPISPVNIEPIKINIPVSEEPKVMEPVKITIPNEPVTPTPVVEPIIEKDVTPIITEPVIMASPEINDTYYKPVEKVESENVSVPTIDFDAIAESISKELDELEKSTAENNHEEVKVTPISEINRGTTNQFSSVYVNTPTFTPINEHIDLPKKIDLPTKKDNEIEPENYNL